MGLKLASRRHPDVFVMAPALTEAGQSQNFKLPSSHSSPTCPINVSLNGFNSIPASQLYSDERASCRDALAPKLKKNYGFEDRRFVYTAKRIVKDTIKPVSNSFAAALASQFLKGEEASEADVDSNGGNSMMSSCDPSMGDDDNTMGLQKASLEAGGLFKEKLLSNDVDQLLRNLGAAISQDAGSEMSPNVEELLQVMKSLEGGGGDAPLHGDADAEGMFGADLAGGLSTFERELLSGVDVMDMCEEADDAKEAPTTEHVDAARRRLHDLERECERSLRRLRKLQARVLGTHAAGEAAALLARAETAGGAARGRPPGLAQRLDMLSQQQAARHHVTPAGRYFGSGSAERAAAAGVRLGTESRRELAAVSGQLRAQLGFVEAALDSDATASSSGGESCDEMQSFNNPHQLPVPIAKRSAWRWAQDRAMVASRWTWLQAQISDLEYRIRQHNDIAREVRSKKGPVEFEDSASPRTNHVVVNGFHGTMKARGTDESATCGSCSRVRPLVCETFRKRTLINVADHKVAVGSKRAARPTSMLCWCTPSRPLCALCASRPESQCLEQLVVPEKVALHDPYFHPVLSFPSDTSASAHYSCIMHGAEWQQRILRTSVRMVRVCPSGASKDSMGNRERLARKQEHQRRKYTSRLKRAAASMLSAKIKRKLTRGRKSKNVDRINHPLQRLRQKRHSPKLSIGDPPPVELPEDPEDELGLESAPSGCPSKQSSPVPSPCPPGLGPVKERRKRENSYDIDNIVIPHSIASSTRVERLPYKEIPTPMWRVAELHELPAKLDVKNNGVVQRSSQDCDRNFQEEDLRDEVYAARHDRCEVDEKKKFMSYLKLPNHGRSRMHRRTDSRAESSGANTPDPMSPPSMQDPPSSPLPVGSPPATPLSLSILLEGEGGSIVGRRRTVSSSQGNTRPSTPTDHPYVEVLPYDPRIFPLSADMYDKMMKQMPDGHSFPPVPIPPKKIFTKNNYYGEVGSRPPTPSSDSTESAVAEGELEDPNDPEWTIR
ncbi:KAT8 regulatory NSL complex subunit 1 isoform X1 [Bacillus rossius redtenbacheri]|uniref:KAT8 regulatory NSL complex subunit 1 isoform X1 n=1 Tax=Bacillus rossius redtenbacheri TaxID=93214 RepID=UPI002FDE1206